MRVNSVIVARAGRFVSATVRDRESLYAGLWGHLYLPDVVNSIKQKYGFVGVPETLFDLQVSDTHAARFQHGKFVRDARSVLISSLEVYRNWVVATTESSTEDAEAFLSDLLTWFSGTYFAVTTNSYIYYLSQLEVVLDADFGTTAHFITPARTTLSEILASYNQKEAPRIEMSGFSLRFDATKSTTPATGAFTLDRREGHAYEEKIYFSQAPLKTPDHFAVLTEIERALKQPS